MKDNQSNDGNQGNDQSDQKNQDNQSNQKNQDSRVKTEQDEKEVERNKGRGVPNYDEKNPNPSDIHSDDPMVAGLANGERQARGEGDKGGPVK